MKLFTNLKYLVKLSRGLTTISHYLMWIGERIKSLDETILAQSILINTKPISLDYLDELDIKKVSSPLLKDLLASRQKFMSSPTEIVNVEITPTSPTEEWDNITKAWREMGKDLLPKPEAKDK